MSHKIAWHQSSIAYIELIFFAVDRFYVVERLHIWIWMQNTVDYVGFVHRIISIHQIRILIELKWNNSKWTASIYLYIHIARGDELKKFTLMWFIESRLAHIYIYVYTYK